MSDYVCLCGYTRANKAKYPCIICKFKGLPVSSPPVSSIITISDSSRCSTQAFLNSPPPVPHNSDEESMSERTVKIEYLDESRKSFSDASQNSDDKYCTSESMPASEESRNSQEVCLLKSMPILQNLNKEKNVPAPENYDEEACMPENLPALHKVNKEHNVFKNMSTPENYDGIRMSQHVPAITYFEEEVRMLHDLPAPENYDEDARMPENLSPTQNLDEEALKLKNLPATRYFYSPSFMAPMELPQNSSPPTDFELILEGTKNAYSNEVEEAAQRLQRKRRTSLLLSSDEEVEVGPLSMKKSCYEAYFGPNAEEPPKDD